MNYYENYLVITKENESIFENDQKKELSILEKIGLETVLDEFIKDYELTNFGESYTKIKDFTRYNESSVDILNGYTDTYVFDNYAIGEIWTTNNGCIMMTVADLTTWNEYDENEMDLEDVVENCDIWCDCEIRYIRLN